MVRKKQWTRNRPKQAYKLALLGATDREIADFMEVNQHTITLWKRTKPMFKKWLDRGKMAADARVVKATLRRALGYNYVETRTREYKGMIETTKTTKHVAADPWLLIKWLTIRTRGNDMPWADISKSEIIKTINVNAKLDLSEFTLEELMVAKKMGLKNAEDAINKLKDSVSNN